MGRPKSKKEFNGKFLDASSWERQYGEGFEEWRKDRWKSSSKVTKDFLEHLLPLGTLEGEKRLMPHQAEALQRIIYSFEVCRLNPLMTTLATGTGKTVVMAGVIAWLACREEIAETFVLFCPNTIVRDRLKRDFESLLVFKEFNLFPLSYQNKLKTLSCSVVEGFQNFSNLLGKNVIVANRHQFQKGYQGGNDHLTFLQENGGNIAVFNDEAHNTRGREYTRTLKILQQQTTFRLDVTATPDRADHLRPQCHELYNLSAVEAITGSYRSNSYIDPSFKEYPPLVKDVVVQRPLIEKLKAIKMEELKFRDLQGNAFNIRDINWEDWPKQKNLQLVMDPGGMKMQLQLAYEALERKKNLAKERYKPLLFAIAPSVAGAKKAVEMMRKDFGLKPLLVVGDVDSDVDIKEKKKLREAAANLGNPDSPYDSVVSVYMLREGWDVPEVAVMCLLRGFGSPLFAHQVLGRGLRIIRRNGLSEDRSIQELTVIDHPCLQLDDLWAEIDALVKDGEEISREREIPRDGTGEVKVETQEIPIEQKIVRPELQYLLKVPSPKEVRTLTSERALDILDFCLNEIQEYDIQSLMIVGGKAKGVEKMRPQRKVENIDKDIEVSAIPSGIQDREKLQEGFTGMLMDWAKDYSDQYAPFVTCCDEVYRTLLKGFEKSLFGNQVVVSVEAHILYGAQNILPQIKESVTYNFNFRIYQEETLTR